MPGRWSLALVLVLASLRGVAGASAAAADPLDAALERYRGIAASGGWRPIAASEVLRPGARSPAIATLRTHLALTGDLATVDAAGDAARYDPALRRAVESFQRRHGLRADGVVGGATLEALNVPAAERVVQLGLARLGAREPVPGGRWIHINVARFWLQVLDGERVVLEMPIVVGRPSRPTPLFDKQVSAIVVNPPWTVPEDLAYLDLLPKIMADPRYLAQRQIDVYESWEPGAPRLDPRRIDWKNLGRGIQTLTLRQRPGPGNALGRMMFRMEGEQEIFLHDTPAREVFAQERRDLSSGCIRVADALGLARAIADPETRRSLGASLAGRDTVAIPLPRAVPIRTRYETAWVDERGRVHFRDDIYGEDARRLATALYAAPRR
jgi:murein L,D-transpeptidase YcbB/YkuD